MTRPKDLPEAATKEPRIRSPAEEEERAAQRQEKGDALETADEALHLGDPDNPLRIPGEMSSRPKPERDDEEEPEED